MISFSNSGNISSNIKALIDKTFDLTPTLNISNVNPLLFTLWLPESMHSVHPVFHVSILKPTTSNTFSKRIQPAPAPVIIDGEPEYEISQIVDSKINH